MNIRGFAGVAAIAATGLLAYGLHQLVPEGQPLTRSEVIGELDGPPLAGYSRTRLYRYDDHQYLTGQLISGDRELAGLGRAPVLDALVPAAAGGDRPPAPAAPTPEGAPASGRAQALLRSGAAAREVRNLIYGGRDNGRYALLGSIGGDAGVTLIGTPGQALYLVTGTLRRPAEGEQPPAREVLRSDDQGASWRRDPEVALGAPQRHTMFLSDARALALADGADGERLLVSEDGARRWSTLRLREQVWPDSDSYGKAFSEHADRAGAGERLAYGWSLYPVAADRAVGWSWRDRVAPGGGARRIETRRFEVRLQDGAPPAFRITPDVAPVPAQDPLSWPVLGQPVYATHGNRIFRLEPDQGNWHELAATPDVRGRPTWIGQAWFGRQGWVVQTYADHLFSFGDYTRTYFYTRDQGRNWRPFQLSPDQERGLLGLDAAGEGVLVHAVRDGRTLIVRYALE
ncbi:ATP synthase F0 subunit C [Achromobacter denitrificans]|nr:ATP synthase F0 subunit C [Achromobacter denitrificans]